MSQSDRLGRSVQRFALEVMGTLVLNYLASLPIAYQLAAYFEFPVEG
ncbi:MAG: hypothetical protein ABJK59_04600 [Erythrobacter sp.]